MVVAKQRSRVFQSLSSTTQLDALVIGFLSYECLPPKVPSENKEIDQYIIYQTISHELVIRSNVFKII